MNVIVTGPKGAGKSESLLLAAQTLKAEGRMVGGVISRGFWLGGIRTGYEIVNPATGNTLLLCSRGEPRGDMADNMIEVFKHGAYHFFKPAFLLGNIWIREGLSADVLFIDEIGAIEMADENTGEKAGEGSGWDFRRPFLYDGAKKPALVFGVREEVVEAIVKERQCPWKTIRLKTKRNRASDILGALSKM